MDESLLDRAHRLKIGFGVSLFFLVLTICVSYAILDGVISTQQRLINFRTQVDEINLALADSNSVVTDLNLRTEKQEANRNVRLTQLIVKRIGSSVALFKELRAELHDKAELLKNSSAWSEISWVIENNKGGLHYSFGRYLHQLDLISSVTEESDPRYGQLRTGQDVNNELVSLQMIPVDAAGARNGALSLGYQRSSAQLSEMIESYTFRVRTMHALLTLLVIVAMLLMSMLVVSPLWRGLLREHGRLQNTHGKLRELAYFDKETGLPNLHGLESEGLSALRQRSSVGAPYLFLIKITNIDDLYNLVGSQSASDIHSLFAARLQRLSLDAWQWSRAAESEYVTLLSRETIAETEDWLESVYAILSKPLQIGAIQVRPELSLAVSDTGDQVSVQSQALLEHQIRARMASQLFNPSSCKLPIYEMALTEKLLDDNELLTQISESSQRGEFIPFYQIKVDARTGKPSSMEALCRWRRADGSIAKPDSFIRTAEKSGLIVPITYHLLDQIVRDINAWNDSGVLVGPVSINLASDVLLHSGFIDKVSDSLSRLPSNCGGLEVEVTENIALGDNYPQIREVLGAVRDIGLKVSVDDFGTGYASLQTLIELPYDILKIDRSFVQQMQKDGSGSEVVTAMISLANNLKKTCIVEGIEAEWQWRLLTGMGADELQGFYFHRPATAEDTCNSLIQAESQTLGLASNALDA